MKTLVIPRNPWPMAIVVYFIVFISSMATFIAWAVRQDMDLVRPDYYEAEIRHQQQVDRVQRTQGLGVEVAVAYDTQARVIHVSLPASHAVHGVTGRIDFYRPSDARLDHQVPLVPDTAGVQKIDGTALRPGLWRVRVAWECGGNEYYAEQAVVVAGGTP